MLFCYPLFQIMIIVKRCLAIFKYRLIGTISKVKFATTYAAIAHSCHFVRQGGNVLTVDLEQLELRKLCNLYSKNKWCSE